VLDERCRPVAPNSVYCERHFPVPHPDQDELATEVTCGALLAYTMTV